MGYFVSATPMMVAPGGPIQKRPAAILRRYDTAQELNVAD
jgi:hypothetical protein